MLIGTTQNNLDSKGRLALSRRWRAELASGVIVTRGFDKCLFVFSPNQFEKIALEVDKQGIASSIVRVFARHLVALAEYIPLDKQGRISVPPHLRQFADLQNTVTVVGVINRLEVWNPQTFVEINLQSEKEANTVAEKYGAMIHQLSSIVQ